MNRSRAKLFNYRAALWDGSPRLPTKAKFDGILVDAPCSGVGTWQRNPHARWTTTPNDVAELAAVQAKLLGNIASSVKPGGRLVYAVCTLTRAETTAVARGRRGVAVPEILRRTGNSIPHGRQGCDEPYPAQAPARVAV